MVLDKLSKEAKLQVMEDLGFANDICDLVFIADKLDEQGHCEAAEILDDIIKSKAQKLKDPVRMQVRKIRKRIAEEQAKYYTEEQLE